MSSSGKESAAPARYLPERPFPPYAFLPGRDPHPTRHPDGHSFGTEEGPAAYLEPARWAENEDYLYGVDLYNHGFLWEAHEAWEGLWHSAKHDASQAALLQGLIQCTAACLKVRMEQPRGLERLSALGTGRLDEVRTAEGERFMGLELGAFAAAMRAWAAGEPTDADTRPRLKLES